MARAYQRTRCIRKIAPPQCHRAVRKSDAPAHYGFTSAPTYITNGSSFDEAAMSIKNSLVKFAAHVNRVDFLEDVANLCADSKFFRQNFCEIVLYNSKHLKMLRDIYAKSPVIFVHVPRNGGTSISTTLYGTKIWHLTLDALNHLMPNEIKGKPTFAMYRDPIDRFTSAIKFLSTGGTALISAADVTKRKLSSINTIDGYLDYIENAKSIYDLDFVLRPQSIFLGGKTPKVDFLFSLDDGMEMIGKALNFPDMPSIPKTNESLGEKIQLSKEQIDRIKRIYADDFALADYIYKP
ncbi:hypothetical protein [Silvimonas sp.]|uniref:hypothetical protein n=1 Tax=Silvimonas sp. TaxID=2650811 RepID=UPI00285053FF|nr:hypothetical protein [Silvimonas sp.]MDR3429240.1 hypothetical protein [Silvimonas sp.]